MAEERESQMTETGVPTCDTCHQPEPHWHALEYCTVYMRGLDPTDIAPALARAWLEREACVGPRRELARAALVLVEAVALGPRDAALAEYWRTKDGFYSGKRYRRRLVGETSTDA